MVSKVVFYGYDFKTDKETALGSIAWNGKAMTALGETPQRILDELSEYGIKDYTSRKVTLYFPSDGLKFLRMLKYRYDNPYLRASDVKSG
jgi:hypothetical protein